MYQFHWGAPNVSVSERRPQNVFVLARACCFSEGPPKYIRFREASSNQRGFSQGPQKCNCLDRVLHQNIKVLLLTTNYIGFSEVSPKYKCFSECPLKYNDFSVVCVSSFRAKMTVSALSANKSTQD